MKGPGGWPSPEKGQESDGEKRATTSTGKESDGIFGNPRESSTPIKEVSSEFSSACHNGNNSSKAFKEVFSKVKDGREDGKRKKIFHK